MKPAGGGAACPCTDGTLYDGTPIPTASTYCDMFVCGKDFISYQCGHPWTLNPTGWTSFATMPCNNLACPGTGVFCGNDVLNGVPTTKYTCTGAGKIPTDWVICEGACKTTGAGSAACGPAPGTCSCGPLVDGHSSTTCGEQHCTPTGQGSATTMMMCTSSGWQDLGQSLDEKCEPTKTNDCAACKGMQDKNGKEIITTECGRTVCGIGKSNDEYFACTPGGWVDIGTPCPAPKPGDPEPLGKCPDMFEDQKHNKQAVEDYQTFCGGQTLFDKNGNPTIKLGGDPGSLYACAKAGAEPRLVKTCAKESPCRPVSKLPAYEQKDPKSNASVLIKDWDRCLEPCPPWSEAYQYKPGKLCAPVSDAVSCVRHYTCGQNPISGRPGTRYSCFAEDCNTVLESGACTYGVPLPVDDCTLHGPKYTCQANDNSVEDTGCFQNHDKAPWGVPPPVVADTERCSAIRTYQGLPLPAEEATLGKSVCGLGMQVYRCETRAIGRPDGWVSTGEPCGTDCAGCALDLYGNLPQTCWSKCKSTEQCLALSPSGCDDTTKDPADIPCRSPKPGAKAPTNDEPAYCGDNPALGAKGDPRILYTCKARCPGTTVGYYDCDASNPGWALRKYTYSKAEYCEHGCRITDPGSPTDECILLPGLGFGDAVDDKRVVQNLGHYNPLDDDAGLDGTHLGEDIKPKLGTGVGAIVRAIGPGKVLFVGDNASQYHATVLLEHWVKDPGEKIAKRYCSFYGHLNRDSVHLHKAGDKVQKGEKIATIESWAAIESAHDAGTSGGDNNSHLHYVLLDDAFCKAFEGGGGPCGYDGETSDLWDVPYNDDAGAKESIVGGAPKGSCSSTQGKTLYAPRIFAANHPNAKVCASLEDCK
ncbi:hypothetical protein A7982_13161 [Minicystis rosea]|nr:hypothetical protein A7982_13161 [Minicystis rosea]